QARTAQAAKNGPHYGFGRHGGGSGGAGLGGAARAGRRTWGKLKIKNDKLKKFSRSGSSLSVLPGRLLPPVTHYWLAMLSRGAREAGASQAVRSQAEPGNEGKKHRELAAPRSRARRAIR